MLLLLRCLLASRLEPLEQWLLFTVIPGDSRSVSWDWKWMDLAELRIHPQGNISLLSSLPHLPQDPVEASTESQAQSLPEVWVMLHTRG